MLFNRKHAGNLEHYENTKPKNNRNRRRLSIPKTQKKLFNKIIEENFPNLKKQMPINVKEAYTTPNRVDQKKKILPPHNN